MKSGKIIVLVLLFVGVVIVPVIGLNSRSNGAWLTPIAFTESTGRHPSPTATTMVPPTAVPEVLPEYIVMDTFKPLSGGTYGFVVVSEFSRDTPVIERETVLWAIMRKEGIIDASLYSTIDAYKADSSASYLRTHPDALRTGFLGTIESAHFTAGEEIYP